MTTTKKPVYAKPAADQRPPKMEGVKEWIPVTPRSNGTMRRWDPEKDPPTILAGWLGVTDKGIGTALQTVQTGEPVSIKPFKFIRTSHAGTIFDNTIIMEQEP
jgi:hypothetical protein